MTLHLHDLKTARFQSLTPVTSGHVGIYLCGAIAQGSPHVDHLRAAVAFDFLIRWLRRSDMEVTYVRNVTDIDDKILNKSAQAQVLRWVWAYHYEREPTQAYEILGALPLSYEPRATGHISKQIDLVRRLTERGHAHGDGRGSIYFEVHSQLDYGSLTCQRPAGMHTTEGGAQIDAALEAGKRDPKDFALQKSMKPGEPETASWESPWGQGRPGWHLECSAMARRYLDEEFDTHGGGIDLRFPHHENEQAQSHDADWGFARLWVRNAWVTTKGEKMSEFLGNALSIGAFTKDLPAVAVRWALSTVHHHSVIEWGEETLPAAAAAWSKLSGFAERSIGLAGEACAEEVLLSAFELPEGFATAMNDDLNVAGALAVIHEHIEAGNTAIDEGDKTFARREQVLVRSMLDVPGLDPASDQWRGGLDAGGAEGSAEHEASDTLVRALTEECTQAHANKDWARADALRDRLTQAGIAIADGREGASRRLG